MVDSRRSFVARISAFSMLPLAALIAPILVLPIIARATSPAGWAALVVAQVIGSLAGVIILSGWSIYGAASVARTEDPSERDWLYLRSLKSRIIGFLVVVPLSIGICVLIASRGVGYPTNSLMVMSSAWPGLSMSWFAIASGRAGWIARYELGPRLAATGVSAIVVAVTHEIWTYPVLLFGASLVGLAAFHRMELGAWVRFRRGKRPVEFNPLELLRGAAFSIIGSAYASAPLLVASSLQVGGLAALASADRIYRYTLIGVTALANALQGWVYEGGLVELRRRQILAIRLHTVIGVVGTAVLVILGPTLGGLLFGADVAPGYRATAFYAGSFLAVAISTPMIRNVLIPANRSIRVLVATLVSGAVGLAIMITFGRAVGAVGVVTGLFAAEVIGTLMLVRPTVQAMQSPGRRRA